MSALLRERGTTLSEAMVFGVGAGLTFAYLPFVKLGGLPLISYRMPPKSIMRGVSKRLGIRMQYDTFKTVDAGMRALDEKLAAGRVVGLQTSVFWLPYFPPDMRFHFNAHNLVVYAKRGDTYLISDPVFEHPVECDAESLAKARFVRGALAPKGLLYYPTDLPANVDLEPAIKKSINFTTGMMLHTPLPIIGIRGIRHVARKIGQLNPADEKRNKLLLGHIVRMQEEIGTGGAGFRFLYSAFLQEASRVTGIEMLGEGARDLTAAGDQWRQFALTCARMCKARETLDYGRLADTLTNCAMLEQGVYRKLRRAVR
ncbi:MAG: BtrH N-terminal domain-containing protein [Phycisphaerae bacterium]|nr:BtrH N-terminal domain-containing protein [Gemmatimonadaceae bacterium]